MSVRLTPTVTHQKEEQLNHLDKQDEVQGTLAGEKVAATKTQLPTDRVVDVRDLGKTIGEPTASTADRTGGADDLLSLMAVSNEISAGGVDMVEMKRRLIRLGGDDLSISSQKDFIRYVESRKLEPQAMAWVANEIRHSLFDDKNGIGPLRAYFNSKGIKVFSNDKVDGRNNLNRDTFRERIAAIEESGGVVDKAQARKLLSLLNPVVDRKDLLWAQWQIQRRVHDGTLRFEQTTATALDPYEKAFHDQLNEKLGGEVNEKEVRHVIEMARGEGFSQESIERVKTVLARAKKDPDALFAAQEAFRVQIEHAQNALTRDARKAERRAGYLQGKLGSCESAVEAKAIRVEIADLKATARDLEAGCTTEVKALENVGAQFSSWMAPKLEDKIDRKTMRAEIRAQVDSGQISRSQAHGLMTAVSLSVTRAEYGNHRMAMWQQMMMQEAWAELQESFDEMMEAFRRNMSSDEYDANGNLIETASEKHFKVLLREQLAKRVLHTDMKQEARDQRSDIKSDVSAVKSKRATATTAGEVADHDAAHASLETAKADVDPPPPVT